jgi:hypothetical protein
MLETAGRPHAACVTQTHRRAKSRPTQPRFALIANKFANFIQLILFTPNFCQRQADKIQIDWLAIFAAIFAYKLHNMGF